VIFLAAALEPTATATDLEDLLEVPLAVRRRGLPGAVSDTLFIAPNFPDHIWRRAVKNKHPLTQNHLDYIEVQKGAPVPDAVTRAVDEFNRDTRAGWMKAIDAGLRNVELAAQKTLSDAQSRRSRMRADLRAITERTAL
jgi:hypothetical protein